jgi:hypothetical protein
MPTMGRMKDTSFGAATLFLIRKLKMYILHVPERIDWNRKRVEDILRYENLLAALEKMELKDLKLTKKEKEKGEQDGN